MSVLFGSTEDETASAGSTKLEVGKTPSDPCTDGPDGSKSVGFGGFDGFCGKAGKRFNSFSAEGAD